MGSCVSCNRDGDSIDNSFFQPRHGWFQEIPVGGYPDRAACFLGRPRPTGQCRVEQGFSPALQVNMLGQSQVGLEAFPDRIVQVPFTPYVG